MHVNEYGNIPGKAIKNFETYRAGQLCGFEPHIADKLTAAGVWKPTDEDAEAEIKATGKRKAVKKAAETAPDLLVGVEGGTVKIPQNWREATAKERLLWAQQIDAKADKVTADYVIATAVKEQEDALQTT